MDYRGLESRRYFYSSHVSSEMVTGNETVARQGMGMNCTILLTPLERIEVTGTPSNIYTVIRVTVESSRVLPYGSNGHPSQETQAHEAMHGPAREVQTSRGWL